MVVVRRLAVADEEERRLSESVGELERGFISSVSDFANANARGRQTRVPRELNQLHNDRAPPQASERVSVCGAGKTRVLTEFEGRGREKRERDEKSRISPRPGIGSAYFRPRNREEERPACANGRELTVVAVAAGAKSRERETKSERDPLLPGMWISRVKPRGPVAFRILRSARFINFSRLDCGMKPMRVVANKLEVHFPITYTQKRVWLSKRNIWLK